LGSGNYFDVTGTTAITSIATVAVGSQIKLHFDGILTLTHHATDLILPSGANITTAAGDEAEFVEYATGDWRCTNYTKADGAAVVASGGFWNFISEADINSIQTHDFQNITQYDEYRLIIRNISSSSMYASKVYFLSNTTPHGVDAKTIFVGATGATTVAANVVQTLADYCKVNSQTVGYAIGGTQLADLRIFNLQETEGTVIQGTSQILDNARQYCGTIFYALDNTTAYDGIRVKLSSASQTGTITLLGANYA
jgi:hypothetical protein